MIDNLIKEIFSYDPITGKVTDNTGLFQFSKIHPNGKTYLKTSLGNKQFLAHRIAWFLHFGKWPEYQIDHINGDGTDNRIQNLRDVTCSQNQKNRRLSSNNKTGITGVFFSKNAFVVQVKSDGKKHYLGRYSSLFEACCVRKSAEKRFNFHPNHGSSRDL